MTRRLPFSLTALVVVGALALAACGDDGGSEAVAETAAPEASAAGEFNDADVTFAQGMIPHHEQAVEMAEIALDPAREAGAEVLALATRVRDAQDPEIQLMRGYLSSWGAEELVDMGDDHEAHGMSGMMTADQMLALEEATGAEFDQMWLAMMIEHHTGALEMARTVQAEGAALEVRELANVIITGQEAEIAEMSALLGG
jgi:uncharacterized protein (DUF305 family)